MILPRRDALGRRLARSLLPPAVVLDVSFVNGLEAIRSLAAAGAPVIAVDHRPSALGFRSRLAHHVLSPDPKDEEAYVAFLAELAERDFSEPAVVLPTHDAPLAARGAQRGAPRGLPAARAAAGTCSSRCSRSATSTRWRRPPASACRSRSRPTDEDEARAAAAALTYPAVVKPGDPIPFKRRFGRPVLVCQTPEELLEAWRSAADCEPLLQEVIPGDDATLWTVGSYTDASGTRARAVLRPQARADAARLRHLPRGRGALARGRRRAGARAAGGARLPRHRADRVPARPARRALQADGGESRASGSGTAWRAPAASICRASPTSTCSAARSAPCARGRSTTAAAGSWPPRTCAPRARRARRCAARCARSGPHAGRGHVRRARSAARDRAGERPRDRADRARLQRRPRRRARDHAAAVARPPAAGDARRHDLAQAALVARRRATSRSRTSSPPASSRSSSSIAACGATARMHRVALGLLLAMAALDRGLPGRLLRAREPRSSSRSTPRAWPSSSCTSRFLVRGTQHVIDRGERLLRRTIGAFVAGPRHQLRLRRRAARAQVGGGVNLDKAVIGPLTFGQGSLGGINVYGQATAVQSGSYVSLGRLSRERARARPQPPRDHALRPDPPAAAVRAAARTCAAAAASCSRRCSAFFLVVEVLTLSRSGFLGLACGLAVLAWPLRRQLLQPRARRAGRRRRSGASALALASSPYVRQVVRSRVTLSDNSAKVHFQFFDLVHAGARRASGVRPRPQHVLGLLPVPDGQDELGPALVLHRAARRDGPRRRGRVRGVPGLGRAAAGGDPARLARAASASATPRPATGARSASASAPGSRPR